MRITGSDHPTGGTRGTSLTDEVNQGRAERTARIAEIRRDIRTGVYSVDFARLAAAIADDEMED